MKLLFLLFYLYIRSEEFASRWETVEKSILETGTYDLTFEELEYGVQLAWRNEPRCTARIQWGNLVSQLDPKCDFVKRD